MSYRFANNSSTCYLEAEMLSSIDLDTEVLSLFGWIYYPSTFTSSHRPFGYGTTLGSNTGSVHCYNQDNTKIGVRVNSSTNSQDADSGSVVGAWTPYMLVYHYDNGLDYYGWDNAGTLSSATDVIDHVDPTGAADLLILGTDLARTAGRFNGYLAEIALFDAELTSANFTTLTTLSGTYPNPGLFATTPKAYYSLRVGDGVSGTGIEDQVGGNPDLTNNGSATSEALHPNVATYASGSWPTVTFDSTTKLVSRAGTAIATLDNVKYSVFEGTIYYPTDSIFVVSGTDGQIGTAGGGAAGEMTLTLTGSSLASSSAVTVILYNSVNSYLGMYHVTVD